MSLKYRIKRNCRQTKYQPPCPSYLVCLVCFVLFCFVFFKIPVIWFLCSLLRGCAREAFYFHENCIEQIYNPIPFMTRQIRMTKNDMIINDILEFERYATAF